MELVHRIEEALAGDKRLSRLVVTRDVVAALKKRLWLKVGCGVVG
jgi:hypothetical protein